MTRIVCCKRCALTLASILAAPGLRPTREAGVIMRTLKLIVCYARYVLSSLTTVGFAMN
jgi:hypothetical protein